MSASEETLMTCPRTGTPCSFLVDCALNEQALLAVIDDTRVKQLGNASSIAIREAELAILTETGHVSEAHLGQSAEFNEEEDTYEQLLLRVIESQQVLIEFNRTDASYARNSCIVGPVALRQHIITGNRTLRCTSLFVLANRVCSIIAR